jgi:STAS domain
MDTPVPFERLRLPATCDAAAAQALKSALAAHLAAGTPVVLDGRDVAEPSVALIQLVEAASAAFAARDLRFGIGDPSDALCSAYEDIGLYASLMQRLVMDA